MEKEQFLRFKEDLKAKTQEQRELKNQRKTEHFKGERTINPYDAAEKVRRNKSDLDTLYVIYYILKHRIEVTPETKEQVIWEAYVRLHSKYKEARHENIECDKLRPTGYYLDNPYCGEYTVDYAMCYLMKLWDKILKKYGEAE